MDDQDNQAIEFICSTLPYKEQELRAKPVTEFFMIYNRAKKIAKEKANQK